MAVISTKTLNLAGYTLVIGGSFYLGTLFYPFSFGPTQEINIVALKKFSPDIETSLKKDLTLKTGGADIIVKRDEIQDWIELYIRDYTGQEDKRISHAPVNDYLLSLAPRLNKNPVDAKLKFQNNKADIFVPPQSGRKLGIEVSANLIIAALMSGKSSASLYFDTVEPDITLEKINDLGINTLIGQGESDYGKSPASRIHNIKIGMARYNGIIIKPGEEFSFNETLGQVDDKEGYEAELVIKNGELVREYGGGLCQVSTTVFRAAALAGLNITERRPHSFPVQYYNPQGFDSTIYPGIVDLKFVNNTPNHILIQSKVTGSRLTVEIYGSDDGRKVTIEGPVQYDHKPNGAMKAYFIRKIALADGTESEERFNSNYKAPPTSPLEKNPLE